MSWTLVFTNQYEKRARRFLKRHPSLRLHSLGGRHSGLHSVSINLSYRITLELLIREQEIIPINVGDHDTVY
jgi:toxin HigB-1